MGEMGVGLVATEFLDVAHRAIGTGELAVEQLELVGNARGGRHRTAGVPDGAGHAI